MSSHPHITLITPTPVDLETRQKWLDTVKKYAPNGVIGSASILSDGHRKQSQFYVQKINENLGGYVVPLTRDLTTDEAGIIAVAWNKCYEDGDFDIDFSQTQQSKIHKSSMKNDLLNEIAHQIAKRLHGDWIKERVSEGWGYGPKLDRKQRRDPRLLPWEQLTETAKKSEISRVRRMLDILENINLQIVRR